ncbi:hypothetical protein RRG08_012168 [Elysia crispata]|uniref:Uncharacterized protein n=1 Tax=Elysia crispata TaxID=231223 RepID=A0AAE0ZKF6_9GAST|nr:hypothetical protein RRG08_012168 [Elysia crispata]
MKVRGDSDFAIWVHLVVCSVDENIFSMKDRNAAASSAAICGTTAAAVLAPSLGRTQIDIYSFTVRLSQESKR